MKILSSQHYCTIYFKIAKRLDVQYSHSKKRNDNYGRDRGIS